MEFKHLILENNEGIFTLTINRPKSLNALNNEVLDELQIVFDQMSLDQSIKAILVTGAGEKAFVAGADISEMVQADPKDAFDFTRKGQKVMRTMEKMSKPIIAVVNGFALGGGFELAIACDFIYASDNAKFGLPEVTLGIMPGFGGTQTLPRLIGSNRASELIFTGKLIDAEQAEKWGIVNAVFTQDELMEGAIKAAKKIINNALVAVGFTKEMIDCGMNMSKDDAFKYESSMFATLFAEGAQREGMTAFLEKRKANFNNK